MTPKEFIETVNNWIEDNEPVQTRYYDEWLCDFNIEHDEIFYEEVWQGNRDGHRWYDLADIVYEITDGNFTEYYKTNLIVKTNGEMQSYEDCYHDYPKFVRVYPKEVTTIIYVEDVV